MTNGDSLRGHMLRPCENCPYRMDAPRRHWHRGEFERVLANENAIPGTIFACHKQIEVPPDERGLCAGWFLDQKKRRFPCIALRLVLLTMKDPQAYIDTVNAKGLRMFPSVEAMCRANGVGT